MLYDTQVNAALFKSAMQNAMVKKAIALTYCLPEMSIFQVKCQLTLSKKEDKLFLNRKKNN